MKRFETVTTKENNVFVNNRHVGKRRSKQSERRGDLILNESMLKK